jgi:hypothetical protein
LPFLVNPNEPQPKKKETFLLALATAIHEFVMVVGSYNNGLQRFP